MKRLMIIFMLVVLFAVLVVPAGAQGTSNPNACWGQATKVFARTGEMGEHASQEPTPRLGLRNLARALYADGQLPDDSLQSLGQFVVEAWDLDVSACLD